MGLVLSKQSGAVGYLSLGRQSYDSNAQSFIIAAGITNLTQQIATNNLVTDLKGYNIWTKMKAIYPMVGGTATSHKFNLVDARDLDAAFRLNFVGGWTHSSTGALPNGTTAYANTFLTPSTTLSSINSAHMSYYSRTNITAAQIEMGNIASISGQFYLIFNYVSSRPLAINRNGDGTGVPLLANTTGLLIESRVSGTQQKSYKDGSLAHTANFSVVTFSNAPVYLGAVNDVNAGNTVTNYSTKQCAFASIGEGFTDTEAANFYTAVQKFQTTLGRQI